MILEVLIPLLIVLGVPGFFFFVIVGAGLWEKRPIQTYYVPREGEEYPPSPTAGQANYQAQSAGFHYGGLCHDAKGKLYRVRYDFWISPDLKTFVVVGSGTVAKIPVNGIWLYSRTANGRILCTTNEIGDQDISGAEEQATWPKMELQPLFGKHVGRLNEVAVEPFTLDSALASYLEIRRCKADALVKRNLANYLGEERKVWRYNLKGALTFYFITTWVRPFRRGLRFIGFVRN